MSMTIGEANAVQHLLGYLLQDRSDPLVAHSDRACSSAAELADRSYAVLHTGMDGGDVRNAWPADGPAPAPGLQLRLLDGDGDLWELDDDGQRWVFEFDARDRAYVERLHGPVREVWIRC